MPYTLSEGKQVRVGIRTSHLSHTGHQLSGLHLGLPTAVCKQKQETGAGIWAQGAWGSSLISLGGEWGPIREKCHLHKSSIVWQWKR